MARDGSARIARPSALQAAFEHAPIGMLLLDETGTIVAVNEAACVVLDVNARALIGTALSDRAHPEDVGGSAPERRYRRQDGSLVLARELVSVIPESDPPLRVVTIEDVTERQLAAERLRTQTALAYLGEMASVIAHEVRNAFAGIRGAVEVIGQGLPQGSEEREAVDQVRRRMGALEATVHDLLRFARLRPPRLAPVPIRELLGDVSRSLSWNAPQARLVVEGPDLIVYVDRELFRCALENVCVNVAQAIERAPSEPTSGAVRVEVTLAGELAELRIAGEGRGVPELHDGLLRPFFTTRGGAAGLPIAKRVLEAQGAELGIEQGASGSTAVVRVALAMQAAQRLRAHPERA